MYVYSTGVNTHSDADKQNFVVINQNLGEESEEEGIWMLTYMYIIMCIYMYIHVCNYIYIYIYIHIVLNRNLAAESEEEGMCMLIYKYIYIHIYIYIYIVICVLMYIYYSFKNKEILKNKGCGVYWYIYICFLMRIQSEHFLWRGKTINMNEANMKMGSTPRGDKELHGFNMIYIEHLSINYRNVKYMNQI
jgi:hypothetical protein